VHTSVYSMATASTSSSSRLSARIFTPGAHALSDFTADALECFQLRRLDDVVIEAGLGGAATVFGLAPAGQRDQQETIAHGLAAQGQGRVASPSTCVGSGSRCRCSARSTSSTMPRTLQLFSGQPIRFGVIRWRQRAKVDRAGREIMAVETEHFKKGVVITRSGARLAHSMIQVSSRTTTPSSITRCNGNSDSDSDSGGRLPYAITLR
jgi:hypothetical protein